MSIIVAATKYLVFIYCYYFNEMKSNTIVLGNNLVQFIILLQYYNTTVWIVGFLCFAGFAVWWDSSINVGWWDNAEWECY